MPHHHEVQSNIKIHPNWISSDLKGSFVALILWLRFDIQIKKIHMKHYFPKSWTYNHHQVFYCLTISHHWELDLACSWVHARKVQSYSKVLEFHQSCVAWNSWLSYSGIVGCILDFSSNSPRRQQSLSKTSLWWSQSNIMLENFFYVLNVLYQPVSLLCSSIGYWLKW